MRDARPSRARFAYCRASCAHYLARRWKMKLSTFVGFGMGALTAAIAAKKLDEASGAKKRSLKKKILKILD